MKRFNFFLSFGLCMAITAGAQTITPDPILSPLDRGYEYRALRSEGNGNYSEMRDQLSFIPGENRLNPEKQAYEEAMALFGVMDPQAVTLFRRFVLDYPASPLAPQARLNAADFYFYSADYSKALLAYDEINPSSLPSDLRQQYNLRRGFSLIRTGYLQEASDVFKEYAKEPGNETRALYYLAYIEYARGKYKSARQQFEEVRQKLSLNPRKKNIEGANERDGMYPEWYILQIDYGAGNYESAAREGERFLRIGAPEELEAETIRLTGMSYFRLGDYNRGATWLEKYLETPGASRDPDTIYALGVCAYENNDKTAAEDYFTEVVGDSDDTGVDPAIVQAAYIYLGLIAGEAGETENAALWFDRATKKKADLILSETAGYDYIVAVTRGGGVPFSSSARLMEQFLEKYPDSSKSTALEEYLACVYFNEKNYSEAVKYIERAGVAGKVKAATRQKIFFGAGVEALNRGDATAARRYLTRATEIEGQNEVTAAAWLWLGDACFQSADYPAAEKAYANFLRTEPDSPDRALALYDRAYAFFMQGKYREAGDLFADAIHVSNPPLSERLRDDAIIRIADTRYYTGRYDQARQYYSDAIDNEAAAADYALYRRAIMNGLAGDTKQKLKELASMPSRFPGSRWLPDALLEEAKTYAALGDQANAAKAYRELDKLYGTTPQARKGALELAVIYSENGQQDEAEEALRKIIETWPTSAEALTADADLRKYYASKGRLNEYVAFLESVEGAPRPDAARIEAAAFEGVERAEGTDRIMLADTYIETYPDGVYLPLVLTYKGESLLEEGQSRYPEALETYRELERRGGTEYAAIAAAGIMRTTTDPDERLKYARIVRESSGLPAEVIEEARYVEAATTAERSLSPEAVATLRELATNPSSEAGAKAAVSLGENLLKANRLDEAEVEMKKFTDAGSPHSYWLARGFIVLADIYMAKGKRVLAVEYIRSLRENYPGKEKDIQNMISSRLKKWEKN